MNDVINRKEYKCMNFTLLKQIGINTDSAIERFMGNEKLYEKMLKKFLVEGTFEKLTHAVSEKDRKAALEASHTLKGLCGNLSIDTLFELFNKQVVLMRADKWDEAYSMMTEITDTYKNVTEVISSCFEND